MISHLTRHSALLILAAIVAWAAALRLWRCESSPTGLQIDEASNAWNAYCLLKTGQDEWGQRWPIFYTRAFDDYRSAMYLYLLMPFQAVGGMNVCTTRLPAAIGGIVTVLLVWWIGRRMFDTPTALVAAAFLALSPWHVQHTRWGHEGTIAPLLFSLALAASLWAGAPCVDESPPPRAWKGLLAGALIGITCYGYAALRLIIPASIVVVIAMTPRSWRGFVAQRDGRRMLLATTAGLLITLGPLLFKHLTDSNLLRRAQQTLAWQTDDSAPRRALIVLARYTLHFGPQFLFAQGSSYPALSPPSGYGWLHWYALPLLLAGLLVTLRRARHSLSARLLLALLLSYPAADIAFGERFEPHPLRSFPGLVPLSLMAALGVTTVVRWLAARASIFAITGVVALSLAALLSHVLYLRVFFGPFNYEVRKNWERNIDIIQACDWLRPRLDAVDVVLCTREMIGYPYVLMLVLLEHDPARWFAEARTYEPAPSDLHARVVCARYGKFRFIYDSQRAINELDQMSRDDRRQRVVMILRPWENLAPVRPTAEIRRRDLVWLHIYEFEI